MPSECIICDAPDARVCARCRSAAYCSKECQDCDFSTHKFLCSAYANLPASPGGDHSLGILFPQDERHPKFVWVKIQYPSLEPPMFLADYNEKGLLGADNPRSRSWPVNGNRSRQRDLANTLQALRRADCYFDGSKLNRSIIKVTTLGANCIFAGPVLVMKRNGQTAEEMEMKHLKFLDMKMRDYRDIIDWFVEESHMAPPKQSPPHWPSMPQRLVKAVRINCDALIGRSLDKNPTTGCWRFEQVEVPANHQAFKKGGISAMSIRIGLPIKLWKYPLEPSWLSGLANPKATFLMRDMNPSHAGTWGWAPMRWQNDQGNVLVVHLDNEARPKDITKVQVEALSYLAQHHLQDGMQKVMEEQPGTNADGYYMRRDVTAQYTHALYTEVFEKLKIAKAEEDSDWAHAELPEGDGTPHYGPG